MKHETADRPFQDIHNTFRPRILRYLGRLVGEHEAEDLAVLMLQSAFSGWCPADVVLRPLGMKGKLEGQRPEPGTQRAA